jgi:Na+/H+ antiporter NhaB
MSAAMSATSGSTMPSVQAHLKKENINYILLLFIVVGITFVEHIPIEIRRFFNSIIGSIVALGIVGAAYHYFNWATALMCAFLYVMTINSSILSLTENFEPGMDTRFITNRKKWYVEQVLGENPLIIEETTVKTQAVQDNTSGMSRSIQSGSNL